MAVFSVSSWLVFSRNLKLGELVALLSITGNLMPTLSRLVVTNIQIQEAFVAFDRMFEFALTFQQIYDQERQMKKLSNEERKKLRQEVIVPKLEALHQWMKDEYAQVTPSSPIGKALAYSMKRWRGVDRVRQ